MYKRHEYKLILWLKLYLPAIEFSEEMASTKVLRKIGASPDNSIPPLKMCNDKKYRSEEFWKCYLKHLTFTNYHPTSTCRMGAADDSTAVVDYNLW